MSLSNLITYERALEREIDNLERDMWLKIDLGLVPDHKTWEHYESFVRWHWRIRVTIDNRLCT